jgi:predicted RND superfamily exporter protein
VITAAAAIMMSVFVAFVFGGQRVIAEFGIGLAVAVLLDAFVLRTVLVPALMHLFGKANWWLPGPVDRVMPHLSVEPTEDAEEADQINDSMSQHGMSVDLTNFKPEDIDELVGALREMEVNVDAKNGDTVRVYCA